jgi:hypothetical protein
LRRAEDKHHCLGLANGIQNQLIAGFGIVQAGRIYQFNTWRQEGHRMFNDRMTHVRECRFLLFCPLLGFIGRDRKLSFELLNRERSRRLVIGVMNGHLDVFTGANGRQERRAGVHIDGQHCRAQECIEERTFTAFEIAEHHNAKPSLS